MLIKPFYKRTNVFAIQDVGPIANRAYFYLQKDTKNREPIFSNLRHLFLSQHEPSNRLDETETKKKKKKKMNEIVQASITQTGALVLKFQKYQNE